MDAIRFDRLTVAVARRLTRRTALALLSGFGLSGLLIQDAQAVCKDNGSRCQQGDECCSGRCKRKHGTHKKVCRAAPGQGICTITFDWCATGGGLNCGDPGCVCFRRLNGASVCASDQSANKCAFLGDCTDAKCRTLLNNPQAFCGGGSGVNGCCAGKTGVCLLPCPNPDPVE